MGEGGFAAVYQAMDLIEGVRVALKIPYAAASDSLAMDTFRHEVRVAAQLDHSHILPLKNADFIDGHFVVAFLLGERTLSTRLRSRLAMSTALDYTDQMLDAVAYAHDAGIIHCDIKPENLILFPGNRLMLSDFGLAKFAWRTIQASGSGTVGYIAPEQAMGKPSTRSDVFSLGLIIYRMLAGHLPEWPYEWPPPGLARLKRRASGELIAFCRRAIAPDPRKRFRDAGQMHRAFQRLRPQAQIASDRRTPVVKAKPADWKTIRRRQFQREYGKLLQTRHVCSACQGPVSEAMTVCPWCCKPRPRHDGETKMPQCCPRCHRGMKLDWRYCPWCFGEGFEVATTRQYNDVRYEEKCSNPECDRKLLMPFMRYCPWCRRKVRHHWTLPGHKESCSNCHWFYAKEYWTCCPWCGG